MTDWLRTEVDGAGHVTTLNGVELRPTERLIHVLTDEPISLATGVCAWGRAQASKFAARVTGRDKA